MVRRPSLFAYMLRMQALVGIALVSTLLLLFAMERNQTIAELAAEAIVPALMAEIGRAHSGSLQTPIGHAPQRPNGAVALGPWMPRLKSLQQTLERHGVPVEEIAFAKGDGQPVLWIGLRHDDGAMTWVGFADRVLEPLFMHRMLAGTGLFLAAVFGASIWAAWRISQPLIRLQHRMERVTRQDWAAASAETGDGQSPDSGIAETHAIEMAFSSLCAERNRLERERQLLLAGISHDLRSPLARIRLAAELLPDNLETRGKQAAIVRNIELSDRLIGSFLDYVRVGHLAPDRQVDLAVIAHEVVDSFELPTNQLQLLVPPGGCILWAHPVLVERLLSNLIDNAIKHGGSPVCVEVACTAHASTLLVSDAGTGLPGAEQSPLMEAFARGDASRTTSGVGLGLTVVQQAAKILGANLSFSRKNDRHCVAVVWDPVPRPGT